MSELNSALGFSRTVTKIFSVTSSSHELSPANKTKQQTTHRETNCDRIESLLRLGSFRSAVFNGNFVLRIDLIPPDDTIPPPVFQDIALLRFSDDLPSEKWIERNYNSALMYY